MANKEVKSYKRSQDAPIAITEDHKKAIRAESVTAKILKYTLIAVVLLTLIFNMLALFTAEVHDENLDKFAAGKATDINISSFDLISGWFAKSSFTIEGRVNKDFVYKHAFDYIVDNTPALKAAVDMGSIGSDAIYGAITPKQDKLLDTAYLALLSLEIITLVWLAVLALLFVFSFVKKLCPSQTIINTALIIHFVLTFIMFGLILAITSNSTANFVFDVGVGLWLNILVAFVALGFVIANAIYRAKIKAYNTAA